MAVKVSAAFCILLLLTLCQAQKTPPTSSNGVEVSLNSLKVEWESIFRSSLELFLNDQPSIRDACGNILSNFTHGCQEITLESGEKVLLTSAEDGAYYQRDLVSKSSSQRAMHYTHIMKKRYLNIMNLLFRSANHTNHSHQQHWVIGLH